MLRWFRRKTEKAENIGMFMQAAEIVKLCRPLSTSVLIHVICKAVENSDMDEDEVGILQMRLGFVRRRRYNKSVQE